jgi:glucokinase
MPYYGGVDIGGTKVLVVIIDEKNNVVKSVKRSTPVNVESIFEIIAEIINDMAQSDKLNSVGVGIPGLVSPEGILAFSPNLKIAQGVNFSSELSKRLAMDVFSDNDATCAMRAEFELGAANRCKNSVLITLGTGIGGGIVANSELVSGQFNFAGEFGHMIIDPYGPLCPCGRNGCWERYASGSGLGRLAREEAVAGRAKDIVKAAGGDPESVKGEHVMRSAKKKDPDALRIIDKYGWWIALGIANVSAILDPSKIVLSGGVIESHSIFIDPTRRHFGTLLEGAGYRNIPEIVPATFGERSGAIGAALLAKSMELKP